MPGVRPKIAMDKDHILSEIRRTAQANGGIPLGEKLFLDETGIRRVDWENYWARWGDAITEAGLEPNTRQNAYDEGWLIIQIIEFIREKNTYPPESEFRLKHNKESSFPTTKTLRQRLGSKHEIVTKIVNHCRTHTGFSDVSRICEEVLKGMPPPREKRESYAEESTGLEPGHVYLLKHDKAYKIGRSTDITRRYKEIRVQMPYQAEEIHAIKTDDTVGIENYWHNRFKNKRLEGEWFALSAADVRAFKKRKFM